MIENRIVERSSCRVRVGVIADGFSYAGLVVDLSTKGARLRLKYFKDLPRDLAIRFPWKGNALVLKRWQNGLDAGVEFVPASMIDSWRLVKIVEELAEAKTVITRLTQRLSLYEPNGVNCHKPITQEYNRSLWSKDL